MSETNAAIDSRMKEIVHMLKQRNTAERNAELMEELRFIKAIRE